MFPPLRICSINLEVVSMIDAAKLKRFLQSCKKNNLANGSLLLGTVFVIFYQLYIASKIRI